MGKSLHTYTAFTPKRYAVLRLLTHVRLVRQNVLILSEVSLYVEKSKNLEKICHHRADETGTERPRPDKDQT